MIDPFQIATQGVGPGWSTFSFATQGFGFEIQIEIKPSGGGSAGTLWDAAQPYEIIVRVRYKDRTWEERKYISALAAKSLEKVMASFRSFRTSIIELSAYLNRTWNRTVQVFVKRK